MEDAGEQISNIRNKSAATPTNSNARPSQGQGGAKGK